MERKIDQFKEQISPILSVQEKLLNLDEEQNSIEGIIEFVDQNSHINDLFFFQSFLESISSSIISRPLFENRYIRIIEHYLSKIPKKYFFMFLSKSNMALALFLQNNLIDINDIEKNFNSIDHNSLIYFKDYIKNHASSTVLKDLITKNDEAKEKENLIAKFIREDNLESFQNFVNESKVLFNSKVPWSIFECMFFLNEKEMPTLIEYACFFGSIRIFKYLVGLGVISSINESNQNFPNKILDRLGEFAVIGGNYEIIHILEDHGVKFNEKTLLNSIKFQRNEISIYLIDTFGIQPTIDDIIMSVESNNLSYFIDNFTTTLNFDNDDKQNIKNNLEKIWLTAAKYGRFEILKFLVSSELDFNKNVKNDAGQNILHIAISNGYLNIVEFLIDKKFIDLNHHDEFVFLIMFFYGVPIDLFLSYST